MLVNKYYDTRLETLLGQYEDNRHSITAKAFGHTNEDLPTIFKVLAVKNKDVATVGSSGDQFLSAIYYGAKKVTLIDGCPYAEPTVKLKMAAIKNLTLDEFIKFWQPGHIFDYKIYSRISHELDEQTKQFFDTILLESGECNLESEMISIHYNVNKYSRISDFFNDEAKYNELKEKLNTVEMEFITADILDFPKKLGKHDVILLSNIYDYVNSEKYFQTVKELKVHNLRFGGKMQIYYDLFCAKHDDILPDINKYKVGRVKEVPCINYVLLGVGEYKKERADELLKIANAPLFERFKNYVTGTHVTKEELKSNGDFTNTYILEK